MVLTYLIVVVVLSISVLFLCSLPLFSSSSSASASASASSSASASASFSALEPLLSVDAALSPEAGPPICQWATMRSHFVNAIATTAGVTVDRVTIVAEPTCATGGRRRRLRRWLTEQVKVTFAVSVPPTTTALLLKNTVVHAMTSGEIATTVNNTILAQDPTAIPLTKDSVARPTHPVETEIAALSPVEVGKAAVQVKEEEEEEEEEVSKCTVLDTDD
jgi:hypothetical protein